MTLNGIKVYNYSVGEDACVLTLGVGTLDDARAAISDSMILYDDVGNPFMCISGYSDIDRMTYLETLKAFEITTRRKDGLRFEVDSLRAENDTLKSQLENTQSMLDAILMGEITV